MVVKAVLACPEPEHSYLLPSNQQIVGVSPVVAWDPLGTHAFSCCVAWP